MCTNVHICNWPLIIVVSLIRKLFTHIFMHSQKADPTQFIQIHGRKCRIHLDPAIAVAGDSPAIMQVIYLELRKKSTFQSFDYKLQFIEYLN